jgi:hypothetical protein
MCLFENIVLAQLDHKGPSSRCRMIEEILLYVIIIRLNLTTHIPSMKNQMIYFLPVIPNLGEMVDPQKPAHARRTGEMVDPQKPAHARRTQRHNRQNHKPTRIIIINHFSYIRG